MNAAPHKTAMEDRPIAILGAGAIGCAFAATFQASNRRVVLCDPSGSARDGALKQVRHNLQSLESAGYPRGNAGRLEIATALPEGETPVLVVECGPERVEIKTAIFREMLARTSDDCVIASASSAIAASSILPDPADQARCLVAHPGNPPSLIRVIEIVPAPGTDSGSVARAVELFGQAGFDPVVLRHEIPAFVFNRLQSTLLREAYRLVNEDVIDVEGIDRIVRDGLGPRWALSGPFETADLNTEGGVRTHAERLGPAYAAVGEARGETDARWSEALVDTVERQRRALLPESELPARRAWRQSVLADLLAARKTILENGK